MVWVTGARPVPWSRVMVSATLPPAAFCPLTASRAGPPGAERSRRLDTAKLVVFADLPPPAMLRLRLLIWSAVMNPFRAVIGTPAADLAAEVVFCAWTTPPVWLVAEWEEDTGTLVVTAPGPATGGRVRLPVVLVRVTSPRAAGFEPSGLAVLAVLARPTATVA